MYLQLDVSSKLTTILPLVGPSYGGSTTEQGSTSSIGKMASAT